MQAAPPRGAAALPSCCLPLGRPRLPCRPQQPGRSCQQTSLVQCQAAGEAASSSSSSLVLAGPSLTRRMFERVDARGGAQAGGAGGRTTLQALQAADAAWYDVRHMQTGAAAGPAPDFVKSHPRALLRELAGGSASSASSAATSASSASSSSASSSSSTAGGACMFDAIVAGGTLGVFVAAALAQRGWRVAVVERGRLAGRSQEWNISRKELAELVELGLLSEAEAESVVALEFNPVRVGFKGGPDLWTRDVLNLGVKPDKLIALMRGKLEAAGGRVLEGVVLSGVDVASDGVALRLAAKTQPGGAPVPAAEAAGSSGGGGAPSQGARVQYESVITGRLLLDCMGNASPVVRQLRWGVKPDGVCLVVGGCARGFDPVANTTADIIYTNSDIQPSAAAPGSAGMQYFWEAFPAADGLLGPAAHSAGAAPSGWRSDARTTYMFSYMDAQPWRPSLEQLFEEYWHLMPLYQQLPAGVEQLEFLRLLFGWFPTYRDAPLQPGFDRVLQIGDASGVQSPLSFGGFGALTRHLARLSAALDDALACDALSQRDLGLINPYNPGLSSAWMLQRAMTASRTPDGPGPAPDLINRMLAANFTAMVDLGDDVFKPFLQDVIQFGPLVRTMAAQMVQDPLFVPQLVAHVGPAALADWMMHVGALGSFSALHATAAPLKLLAGKKTPLPPKLGYALRRTLEALEYGSGADYTL